MDKAPGNVDVYELQDSENDSSWQLLAYEAQLTKTSGDLYTVFQQYHLPGYRTMYHRVRAWNGTAWSSWSATVSATTPSAATPAAPVQTQALESPCRDGIVIPDDIENPAGLIADCELLWAMKQGFTNGDEKLNWNADTDIRLWDGIRCIPNNWRVVRVDLGKAAYLDTGIVIDYQLEGVLSLPAPLVEAGGLSEIHLFNVLRNHLEGPIPPSLGNLEELVELNLGANNFTGPIPPSLGKLEDLVELGLGGNRLTGRIPTELGGLTELRELHLDHNDLSGTIPASLGRLSNLQHLSLMDNRLTGSIPSQLGGPDKPLYSLVLANNQLSGPIPASLGSLVGQELERLWIGGNNYSGCIPEVLSSVSEHDLHDLDINFCVDQKRANDRAVLVEFHKSTGGGETWGVPGGLSNWLTNLPLDEWTGVNTNDDGRVIDIFLDSRDLQGTLPASLGNLTELEHLNLSGNDLTGSIPTSLGKLTKLTHLNLSYTDMTGPIPSSLGNLTELAYFNLSGSDFTGSIPSSLGNLAKLDYMNLSSNELTGSIPASLGDENSSLRYLALSHNELTGAIPDSLADLPRLEFLRLGGNLWTSDTCVPDGLRRVTDNDFKYYQHLDFCVD